MVDRFGHDPNVIGWQLDDEIGVDDHGLDTRMQFQAWLRAHYRTLQRGSGGARYRARAAPAQFWVMETQPGSVNWSYTNITLDPGEVQAARLACDRPWRDAVACWQWR